MMLSWKNRVVGWLIAADFLYQSGWGLIGPIFAIFIEKNVHGGLPMIGFIAATFWTTKSLIQPFVGKYIDGKRGEQDDFAFLMGGMIVANLVPLGYAVATQAWHLFLLELVRGVAMACVAPSWYAIYTRHITKDKEAFDWSLDSTANDIATGIAAALGGMAAAALGFRPLFIVVSLLGLLSTLTMWNIRGMLRQRGD